MANFLATARSLLDGGKIGDAASRFELVFEAIAELQKVHSKCVVDIRNVESVFAAFETAGILERLGDLPTERIKELPNAMKTLITKTVELTLRLRDTPHGVLPPQDYAELIKLIGLCADRPRPRSSPIPLAIITFNYDMGLDYALYKSGVPLSYGLDNAPGTPLLKLHGSLNWARCEVCGPTPWVLSDFFTDFDWRPRSQSLGSATLTIGSRLGDFQHHGKPVAPEPVIVPPTWNKLQYHQALSPVWRRAAKELSEARNIFVIGYSLPPTDSFFRDFYGLGSVGSEILERFWVFNPLASSEGVDERFRQLLGPGVVTSYKYFQTDFATATPIIGDALFGR